MILRTLIRNVRDQNWLAVGIEFLIVVAGILLALQVDQWSQDRDQRNLEQEYLARLIEDLQIERARIVSAIGSTRNRLEAIRDLEAFLLTPELASESPERAVWAIETVSWRSFPNINAFVFKELQSTGRLTLLTSVGLRRALAEHYAEIDHDARVGDDLSVQRRFETATAGLATTDELIAVETASAIDEIKISAARGRALAQSLVDRPAATAELPSLAQHHVFNLRAIEDMQSRTDALIVQIEALMDQEGSKE